MVLLPTVISRETLLYVLFLLELPGADGLNQALRRAADLAAHTDKLVAWSGPPMEVISGPNHRADMFGKVGRLHVANVWTIGRSPFVGSLACDFRAGPVTYLRLRFMPVIKSIVRNARAKKPLAYNRQWANAADSTSKMLSVFCPL